MGAAKIKAPPTLFLPCQKRWIEDKSRLKIAEKSRQIGFTWCSAYADMLTTSHIDNNIDLWITSRDELQAKLYIKDVKGWADIYNVAASNLGCQIYQDARGKKHASFELAFANGQIIHSLSSSGDAQAGKRGNRRADEFALNPNNRHLYGIMYPGITWSGTLWIWSTHRGSQNYFNTLINEIKDGNPKKFSHHRITLEDALGEGLLDKLQSKWAPDDERQDWDEAEYFNRTKAESPDEETFAQEYMCEPSDDASAYISYELIDKGVYAPGIVWELSLDVDKDYYMGVDIGRTTDLTVIHVVEKSGLWRLTRRIIELKNMPFTQQEAVIYALLELPQIRRACFDASGIGRQLAEQAREQFGDKVELVIFTLTVKEDLAVTVRRTMEDGYFKIPNTPALIADYRGIRKETTSAGNIRYVGERTSNGHCDRFWAGALCLHAAKDGGILCDPVPCDLITNNSWLADGSAELLIARNNQGIAQRPF